MSHDTDVTYRIGFMLEFNQFILSQVSHFEIFLSTNRTEIKFETLRFTRRFLFHTDVGTHTRVADRNLQNVTQ